MIGLVTAITGQTSILGAPWKGIDQIVIAFPLAFIVTLIVTLATKPMNKEFINSVYKTEKT
jgi:SSS family solute:Na+ symporter